MREIEEQAEKLPEADKEWLDDQLLNRFCIVETEARELYLGGFRDAIHLLMSVGI